MRKIAIATTLSVLSQLSPQLSQATAADINTRYSISISGILIGSADVTTTTQGNTYNINAKGRTAGLSRLVSNGSGTLSAQGTVKGTTISPLTYKMDTVEAKEPSTVNMALSKGSIKKLTALPASSKRKDRVPIQASHKRGVIDPLSGLFISAAQKNNPKTVCNRTIPIFDGWQRFDVKLHYKATIKTPRSVMQNLEDRTIICGARYNPISGHRSKKRTTKYLAKSKDYELWFTPVKGTDLLTPVRMRIGTKYGALVLKAKQVTTSGL